MKHKNAFIFPGQGVQYLGMGKHMYNNYSLAKHIFEHADNIMKFKFTQIMFSASLNKLTKTNIAQPAIFLNSIISYYIYINKTKIIPDMMAGHSLGEITALVASEIISFEQGLLLVCKRANIMAMNYNCSKSLMAVIIGLHYISIQNICNIINKHYKNLIVVIANYNSCKQVVISGTELGVKKLCEILKFYKIAKYFILNVDKAFHSPLMYYHNIIFKNFLQNIKFKKPKCEIYQNISGKGTYNTNLIRKNLFNHLVYPVQWYKTINNMINNGAYNFYDVGPKKILFNITKDISRHINAYSINDILNNI